MRALFMVLVCSIDIQVLAVYLGRVSTVKKTSQNDRKNLSRYLKNIGKREIYLDGGGWRGWNAVVSISIFVHVYQIVY